MIDDIRFEMGQIFINNRTVSNAELMDILVGLKRKNGRLENEVEELYKHFTGRKCSYKDLHGDLLETC